MTYIKPKLVTKSHPVNLDGLLEDAIKTLQDIREQHPKGRLCIDVAEEYGDHCVDAYVSYERTETQAEADERGRQEEAFALRNKEFKRRQYEMLKKEFE